MSARGVRIPGLAPTATGAWRLWLMDLDESQPRRRCCVGHLLFVDCDYDLPVGALIVGVDSYRDREDVYVRVWRVARDGHRLIVERASFLPRRQAFAGHVRRTLRTRLERYPQGPFDPMRPPRQIVPSDAPPNPRYPVRIPGGGFEGPDLWRRMLVAVNEDEPGGYAIKGGWLRPGGLYELPLNTLMVLCDREPDSTKRRVRILRVGRNGRLVTERDSVLSVRASFGTSMRDTMRRLLEKYPPRAGDVPCPTDARGNQCHG